MILTGPAIAAAVQAGEITIEPYEPSRVSPNAYDWRLGDTIRVCDGDLDAATPTAFTEQSITGCACACCTTSSSTRASSAWEAITASWSRNASSVTAPPPDSTS